MPPRLVAVARGNPQDPLTASGVAKHLFDALARRYEIVASVDASLRPAQRAAVATASFHPSRPVWRERFYRHRLAYELQSRNARRGLPPRSSFDAAVQVFAMFQTRGAPYTVDIDTTHEMSRAAWPAWSPFGDRAAERWLALERRTYHDAAHLFARTRAVASSLTGFYEVPPERVTVVGGGFTFDELPKLERREPEPLILFVGREYERKGGDVLLEAFRTVRSEVPGARLVFVGTSEPQAEDGVEVLGRVDDRERLKALYRAAAVFALPSRFEPFAGAAMEAMAFAVPVVVGDSGGMADLVDDGRAGVLVPPGEPAPLARELIRLLREREAAERLGAAGRARVETELNWDRVAERMGPALEALSASR